MRIYINTQNTKGKWYVLPRFYYHFVVKSTLSYILVASGERYLYDFYIYLYTYYIVHGILQATILEWVAFPFSGDLPNLGIKARSPALQADSLPAEPQGKSKNTGVGSLSLLQQIFLPQESNQSILHCRQILYQLSSQGSPFIHTFD